MTLAEVSRVKRNIRIFFVWELLLLPCKTNDNRMKDKIFQKLKQEYSHLGLGSGILQAHAESLAAIGYVTDENIDAVVSAQKTFLTNLQRDTDSRVTEAQKKAKETAKTEYEAEAKRIADEKARMEAEEAARREKEKDMPSWYKEEKQAFEKILKELTENNKTLSTAYESMKSENEKFKVEKSKAERASLILAKAKELGIPDWRIDEGFNIAEDADESAISEVLSKVSNNIKAQTLPSNKTVFPKVDSSVAKADADAVAKTLVK